MANLSTFALLLGILFAIALIFGLVALIVFLVGKKKGEGEAAPRDGSYFDGGYLAYFGYNFLIVFLTSISFGLAYPFMLCVYERWLARHTVICGKRMRFDGTGLQLIGNYILWSILSVLTLGIYSFWMVLNLRKWKVKHTHFVGEEDDNSYFDGTVGGWLGIQILALLVSMVPVVGLVWAGLMRTEWYAKHTVVDSRRLVFRGTLGQFFVKYLLWGLLTGVTFGIFAFFVPVKALRLETENMIDHEHTPEALLKQSEYRNSVQADVASFKSYRVEYEMEGMKAGITDVTSQEDLLNLANGGNRAAQYLYVIRYGEGNVTQEPFASLLASSAASEYAPAMALAAESLPLENEVKSAYFEKSAQGGVCHSPSASNGSLQGPFGKGSCIFEGRRSQSGSFGEGGGSPRSRRRSADQAVPSCHSPYGIGRAQAQGR